MVGQSVRNKQVIEPFGRSRFETLALLEADVSREGQAPIFALAFAQARSIRHPQEQALRRAAGTTLPSVSSRQR